MIIPWFGAGISILPPSCLPSGMTLTYKWLDYLTNKEDADYIKTFFNRFSCHYLSYHTEKELNKGYADIVMEPFLAVYECVKYSYILEINGRETEKTYAGGY